MTVGPGSSTGKRHFAFGCVATSKKHSMLQNYRATPSMTMGRAAHSVQNRIQITKLYAYFHTNTELSGATVSFKLIHTVPFMHQAVEAAPSDPKWCPSDVLLHSGIQGEIYSTQPQLIRVRAYMWAKSLK